MFNSLKPTQGNLLLSEPFMLDSNFERSVILLCEHNTEGTLGFILNNPTALNLSDVIEDIENKNFKIFIGGPVASENLFFIHQAYDKFQSGHHIIEDVYLGNDFEKLIFLIKENLILPNEVKLFFGYSGWEPDQLNSEIDQNSWAVHKAFDTSLFFIDDGEDLWKQALISLGPKYAHIANFPKSPNLN